MKGPLDGISHAEEAVNKDLAGDRNETSNTMTAVWLQIGKPWA